MNRKKIGWIFFIFKLLPVTGKSLRYYLWCVIVLRSNMGVQKSTIGYIKIAFQFWILLNFNSGWLHIWLHVHKNTHISAFKSCRRKRATLLFGATEGYSLEKYLNILWVIEFIYIIIIIVFIRVYILLKTHQVIAKTGKYSYLNLTSINMTCNDYFNNKMNVQMIIFIIGYIYFVNTSISYQ